MSRNEQPTVLFSDRPPRGWRIVLGLMTAATGGIILGWPDVAVVTVAVIVGIHLIVAGVIRVVTALPAKAGNASTRILYLLLGLLLVVAGLLCLRSPFHATALLVILVGLSWIVSGGIELFHGLTGGGGWTVASGVVSLAAGIVVLAYPAPSARAMVWLFGLSLIAIGLVLVIAAIADTRRDAADRS
jgi:uncharacterized membrane protein HdeD (DUF308 family)